MASFSPVSDEMARIIERGEEGISAKMLRDMIEEGEAHKPAGFNESIAERRDFFEGRAREYIKQLLVKLYPKTWTQLEQTLVEINVMRLIAEVDAVVYPEVPHRYLVDDDDSQLDNDDPNAKRFARLIDDADLDTTMSEAELILPLAHNVGLEMVWDPVQEAPKVVPWWPHQFSILSHPRFPNDPNWFYGIVLDIDAPAGAPTKTRGGEAIHWRQIYRRAFHGYDDDTGKPLFGPWFKECLSTEGDRLTMFGDRAQRVGISTPFLLMQTGTPSGVYVDADRNLSKVVAVLNERWTDTIQLDRLQAHTQLVLSSRTPMKENYVGGAGAIMKIGEDDTITPITLNANIDGNLRLIDALAQALAVSRQQAPEAYNRGDYLSGESRRQKDSPREKRRRRMQLRAKKFEERYLLPALIEAKNKWGPRDDKITRGRPRMEPRKTVDFEDPNTKQMRLAVAVDRRWLTDARAATEMGYYPSVDEARGAGVPDALAPVLEQALGAAPDAPHEALEVAPVGEAVSAAPEAQEAAQVALAASGEVAAEGAETIQDTALNGAQTAELRGLLKDVALGEIAKSSAKPLIRASFPAIPEALIDAMLEGIEVRPAPAAEAPQADPPAGE